MSAKAELDELDDEQACHTDLSMRAEKMMVRQLVRSYKVRGIKTLDTAEKVAKHHGFSYVPKD